MEKSPREQFIELMIDNMKSTGLDDTKSKIIATLFLEKEEICLEELSKKTGYSISLISTAIKFMETNGLLIKFKKPHSKKIYVKMENDMIQHTVLMLKRKQKYVIEKVKETLPNIISAYKKNNSSKEELKIIEKYYKDTVFMDKVIEEMIKKLEGHT